MKKIIFWFWDPENEPEEELGSADTITIMGLEALLWVSSREDQQDGVCLDCIW